MFVYINSNVYTCTYMLSFLKTKKLTWIETIANDLKAYFKLLCLLETI